MLDGPRFGGDRAAHGGRARSLVTLAVAIVGILWAAFIASSSGARADQPGASAAPAGPDEKAPPTTRAGEQFFFNRAVGPGKIACADCHAITNPALGPTDDLIRAGHNLTDAFGRGSWWNGHVTTDCGEAAEVCYKRFQGGSEMDAVARVSLVMFMKSHSVTVSSPILVLRVPPGRAPINEGDAARGHDFFRRACAVCHGEGGTGAGGDLAASAKSPKEIADLVRTGEGRMPLFQGDLLTDEQVADVATYAWSLQPKVP
jgi:mono/diheme cytochrome c family protein